MVGSKELKPALSIDDQISLLEKKGLIINHIEDEKNFLLDNNYYRLNIYFHKLMDSSDHFPEGISLLQIKEIYETDNYLRRQIFSMLEPIEIGLKTKLAYYLGNKYGSSAFYKKEIFESPWKYDQIYNSFQHEVSRNKNESVIKHHYDNYSGYFPIWVIVEFLSFNCISNLFSNLLIEDRKKIAKEFYNVNEYYFSNWIHSLSVFRNICAHFSYLFNRIYTVPISLGYDMHKFPDQGNKLFGVFYSIIKLSPEKLWSPFFSSVCANVVIEKLIDWYNFPANFLEISSE